MKPGQMSGMSAWQSLPGYMTRQIFKRIEAEGCDECPCSRYTIVSVSDNAAWLGHVTPILDGISCTFVNNITGFRLLSNIWVRFKSNCCDLKIIASLNQFNSNKFSWSLYRSLCLCLCYSLNYVFVLVCSHYVWDSWILCCN